MNIIEYNLGAGVLAFTAGSDAVLPCPVTMGHQVHGERIAIIDRQGLAREDLEGFDAFITRLEGCAIAARTADCIPILIYDPVHRTVAAVHSGWKGTVLRISRKVIAEMTRLYGTAPAELRAVIGPGICRDCFQVGPEVVGKFADAGFDMDAIWSRNSERVSGDIATGDHIDLFEANRLILLEAGMNPENIEVSGLCTYEDERFYSARRQGAACGRNINAIMLRQATIPTR